MLKCAAVVADRSGLQHFLCTPKYGDAIENGVSVNRFRSTIDGGSVGYLSRIVVVDIEPVRR